MKMKMTTTLVTKIKKTKERAVYRRARWRRTMDTDDGDGRWREDV